MATSQNAMTSPQGRYNSVNWLLSRINNFHVSDIQNFNPDEYDIFDEVYETCDEEHYETCTEGDHDMFEAEDNDMPQPLFANQITLPIRPSRAQLVHVAKPVAKPIIKTSIGPLAKDYFLVAQQGKTEQCIGPGEHENLEEMPWIGRVYAFFGSISKPVAHPKLFSLICDTALGRFRLPGIADKGEGSTPFEWWEELLFQPPARSLEIVVRSTWSGSQKTTVFAPYGITPGHLFMAIQALEWSTWKDCRFEGLDEEYGPEMAHSFYIPGIHGCANFPKKNQNGTEGGEQAAVNGGNQADEDTKMIEELMESCEM